ncbi:hypothetical protein [Rosistilla oblonga]|uniref:hypothetical protein n=1 Tax=Rosistilla oblonga TaxID=2527990 RepID=UPI003A984B93
MLSEYKVSRCSRRCSVLDRPLKPGETFYSVVFEDDEDFARKDISAEAWEGPPEEAIGWWQGKMPEAGAGRMKLAPNHVLLDLLKQMSEQPHREAVRYLLALMLMRKRVVRPLDHEEGAVEGMLVVQVLADNSQIEVAECEIPREERDQIRDELTELLYCEVEES